MANDNFRTVWRQWLEKTVDDIKTTAQDLVAGPLLKKRSGNLQRSIYKEIFDKGGDNLSGEVGTRLPYGVIWELYGVKGPIRAKPGSNLKLRIPANTPRFGFRSPQNQGAK